MEVRRGKNPEVVERPIAVEFSREEIIRAVTSMAQKQTGNIISFDSLQGVGENGRLTSLTLSGTEQVPLSWNSNGGPAINVTVKQTPNLPNPAPTQSIPPVKTEDKVAS